MFTFVLVQLLGQDIRWIAKQGCELFTDGPVSLLGIALFSFSALFLISGPRNTPLQNQASQLKRCCQNTEKPLKTFTIIKNFLTWSGHWQWKTLPPPPAGLESIPWDRQEQPKCFRCISGSASKIEGHGNSPLAPGSCFPGVGFHQHFLPQEDPRWTQRV